VESVDYNFKLNQHSLAGARAALSRMFQDQNPKSLLDVGCGPGVWLRAAQELGNIEFLGVDGVDVSQGEFLVSKDNFKQVNLEQPWRLRRKFDFVFCLEVAEHLDPGASTALIRSLAEHGDRIYFSAACPGQEGQHHVNCQWPTYWQERFNREGYRCEDSVRWRIWDDQRIEPWYRQNMFVAVRDEQMAGKEPRIARVIHPEMFGSNAIPSTSTFRQEIASQVARGSERIGWYLTLPLKAFWWKFTRRLRRTTGASSQVSK